jgi:arylsulfatase A-like enzyme
MAYRIADVRCRILRTNLFFIKNSLLFLLLLLISCCSPETKPASGPLPKSPNFLWIVIDSLRGDIIGNYGVTPELDLFAKNAYVFSNHLVNAAWTRPSTLVFFTGKYASRNPVNFWDYPTPKSEAKAFYQTEPYPLPKYLSQNGIHTVMVGNNPFLTDKNGLGVEVGFQELYDFSNYSNDTPYITKKAISVIDELTSDTRNQKPFFFFLNYNDPHKPYTPPAGYTARIKSEEILDERKKNYLGEVAYIDDQLQLIFNKLKEKGLWDNTIILITADHGEVMRVEHSISPFTGTNTYYGHGQDLFLENIHVPLLVKPQGQISGKKFEQRSQSVDLYPYVIQSYGLKEKSKLDGVSLSEIIKGNPQKSRYYYGETRSTQGVGLDSDFLLQKSFRFHEQGKFWEGVVGREVFYYYDISKDPFQLTPIWFSDLEDLKKMSLTVAERKKINHLWERLRELEPKIPLYTVRLIQKEATQQKLEARVSISIGQIRIKSKIDGILKIESTPRQLGLKIKPGRLKQGEAVDFSFEVYPDVTFPRFQFFEDGVDVTNQSVGVGMFDLSPSGCFANCESLYEATLGTPKISPFNHFQVWQSGGFVNSYTRDTRLETDAMEILKKQGYVQ